MCIWTRVGGFTINAAKFMKLTRVHICSLEGLCCWIGDACSLPVVLGRSVCGSCCVQANKFSRIWMQAFQDEVTAIASVSFKTVDVSQPEVQQNVVFSRCRWKWLRNLNSDANQIFLWFTASDPGCGYAWSYDDFSIFGLDHYGSGRCGAKGLTLLVIVESEYLNRWKSVCNKGVV